MSGQALVSCVSSTVVAEAEGGRGPQQAPAPDSKPGLPGLLPQPHGLPQLQGGEALVIPTGLHPFPGPRGPSTRT